MTTTNDALSAPAAYRIDGVLASREAFYRVACDPARSVAVEACAGAGKTWMLVSRILRALLDGTEPQDILAITFTRKAAGEMRERLQSWIEDFAARPAAELVPELVMRGMVADEARARAADLQALHLRLLAQGRPVQIRTFHSWFASLLRSAPLAVLQELGLPADHELLEDDAEAVALAWPRFFARVEADAEGRKAFMDSVALHGRSQTLKALANALAKRVEFALADAEGVVDLSVEPFGERYPALAHLAAPTLALAGDACRERWLARARLLGAEKNKTPQKAANAVVDAFAAGDAVDDDLPALNARLGTLRKAFFVTDEDRLTSHLAKFPAAQEAEAELLVLLAAERQHTAWQHQRRMARLTRVLLAAFADIKRERGWVDMSDVEGAARRLLGDAELSGWLQQRLDARVRHLLVDEFQDTNPLQWQALYGWLSAYAGAGSGEAPRVFLVGDPKQSIYRFRRAEPQVFKAAQQFVLTGMGGALLSCDHTRRCAVGVVGLLNQVMGDAEQNDGYAGFRTHTTESTEPGAAWVLPQIPRPEGGAGTATADGWRDSLATPRLLPEDSLSAQEARQAADWVAAELAAGLAPGEVMVLSRKRERLGWLREALAERGIACEQPEKQDLAEHPAAQDVIALLDALVSPAHDLSLARALRSPIFGLGDDGLARVARLCRRAAAVPVLAADSAPWRESPSWWGVLQTLASADEGAASDDPAADAALAQAARALRQWRRWLMQMPPHDALAAIYRDGDVLARYARSVPERQREGTQQALQAVLAQALAQDGGRFLGAYRFVRALKAGGIALPQPAGADAVRLLTIHGAKGLEAHTVVMLDTDAPPPAADSMGVLMDWPGEAPAPRRFVFLASEKQPPACAQDLLAHEQQARALEELNALYVALTRAGQRLVASSIQPHRRGDKPSWLQRIEPHAQALEPVPACSLASAGQGGAEAGMACVLDLPAWAPPPADDQAPAVDAPVVEDDTRTRIGLAMHRLLQWVPTPASGFVWGAAHEQAVAREFHLLPAQLREAAGMAQAVLHGEAAWAWDAAQLAHWGSEVDLWHEGQLLRIDRLVRRADSGCWWVLDYKSAMHPERQQGLREQLQRYHRALTQARPGEAVRLAFVNAEGRLIEME